MANRIKFDLESICRAYAGDVEPFDAGDFQIIRNPHKDGEILIESGPINCVSLTQICRGVVTISLGRHNKILANVRLFSSGEVVINHEWAFNSPELPHRIFQVVPLFNEDGTYPRLGKSKALHLELDTLRNHKHLRLDVSLNDGPTFMMLFTFNNLLACAMRPSIELVLKQN